ncbi:hypothetical protein EJF36_12760 [Bacillus sp. HMF5848]|uniref:phosphotransferase enzyme family protein n=1 Tax=Bacillus sp. HMF5848 TaxID=2495421 RepID=UPI000F7A5DDA|nr:phosphotransferase [Bacillus sp. HMF5848]RSK27674.1 hypothetical protein EJF36_12760 [Bacillus sp. HMF5848]
MESLVEKLFNESLIYDACDKFGIGIIEFVKLGDFENYVFEIKTESQSYILRLTHSTHRVEEQVLAELEWINYLQAAGVKTPRAFHSIQNNLTEQLAVEDSYFTACLFEKAKGHKVNRKDPAIWNNTTFFNWGKLIGKMHALTKAYDSSLSKVKRPHWDEDDLLEFEQYIPAEGNNLVIKNSHHHLEKISLLPKNRNNYGLIHTDLHAGNFFVDNEDIIAFDFDDCSYQWFASDIAIPLYYSVLPIQSTEERHAFASDFLKCFLDGYRTENSLDPQWILLIPDFMKLREMVLYSVLHKKLTPTELAEPGMQRWVRELKQNIEQAKTIVNIDFSLYS